VSWQAFKNHIPAGARLAAGDLCWQAGSLWRSAAAAMGCRAWPQNTQRLQGFLGRHAGQRCFILGNGPSLARTDLGRLRGEVTFGLNRAYLLFPRLGFETTYLVAVNSLVIRQCLTELRALTCPHFVPWGMRRLFEGDAGAFFLDTAFTAANGFAADITGRVFQGYTVTYVALQLAFYMGFREAVLIGVDHSFVTQGTPNAAVTSEGDDPNHFSPHYFGRGFRWQLPDLAGSERAYRLARRAFEAEGRRVVDATLGGKLDVFPRVDYDSLF
jgi:hypothetical protein